MCTDHKRYTDDAQKKINPENLEPEQCMYIYIYIVWSSHWYAYIIMLAMQCLYATIMFVLEYNSKRELVHVNGCQSTRPAQNMLCMPGSDSV